MKADHFFILASAGVFVFGGVILPAFERSTEKPSASSPASAVHAPAPQAVDRRELVRKCTDDVAGAQRAWFFRETGIPAPSNATVTTYRSLMAAHGIEARELMPTRNCASLADGPEQPAGTAGELAQYGRYQMEIPAE